MIYSGLDWTRFFSVLVTQSGLALIFTSIIFNINKRKRSNGSLVLSGFFLCNIIAFVLNIIYLGLKIDPLTELLHVIALFLMIWAQSFLILFCLLLLKGDSFIYKGFFYLIISAIIIILLLNYPSGILLNESTNWRPSWSSEFFLLLILFFVFTITIPIIYFELKIKRLFHSKIIKERWKRFYIGIIMNNIALYGSFCYIAIDNTLFRTIWSITAFFTVLLAGTYLYLGIGKPMSKKELIINRKYYINEDEEKET